MKLIKLFMLTGLLGISAASYAANERLLVKLYCGGSWGKDCPVTIDSISANPGTCTLSGHEGGTLPKPGYVPKLEQPALFKVSCKDSTPVGALVVLKGNAFDSACHLHVKTHGNGGVCKMNKEFPSAYIKEAEHNTKWKDHDGTTLVTVTYVIEKQ